MTEEWRDDWREIVADRELRGETSVKLYRRDPAIVGKTELGGHEPLSRYWTHVRAVFLALRIPASVLVRVGLLLPRRSWCEHWLAFTFSYAYWRGVANATGYRGLWRTFGAIPRPRSRYRQS